MSTADDGADRSLGQLVASATAEMSALVHDEIALAKAEMRQDVKRAGIGGAAFASPVSWPCSRCRCSASPPPTASTTSGSGSPGPS